jgi:hypothetical protein
MANRIGALLGVLCIAAALPARAEKEKKIVTLLNQQLGKTEDQMKGDWGSGIQSIQQMPDGRKLLVVEDEPIFRSSPGTPGFTTSKTTGEVDRQGNVSLDTTTTANPPTDPFGLYIHMRTDFYLDATGKVYRWEAWEWPSKNRELAEWEKAHPRWEILDIRELRPDKKGRMKPAKVGNYQGFWFLGQ